MHLGALRGQLGRRVALCNAHARRGFFDARGTDHAHAEYALAFDQQVARDARAWADLEPTARPRERDRVLRPRADAFREWLVEERPKVAPLAA